MNGEDVKARAGLNSGQGSGGDQGAGMGKAEADNVRPVSDAADKSTLTGEAMDRIGRELRRTYDDLLSEPMPDRFAKLLDDLARSEGSG